MNRLRLTLLLATAAAFLLVPAAQAVAEHGEPHLKVNVSAFVGGGGEVQSKETGFGIPGTPPIECVLPEGLPEGSPPEGVCENKMAKEEEGETKFWAVGLEHDFGGPKSDFIEWEVVSGKAEGGTCTTGFACVISSEGENAEVNAIFACTEPPCKEPGPELTLNIEEGSGTVASNPAGEGFPCTGTAPKTCKSTSFAKDSIVTLTASPAPGYVFKSWKKCDPLTAETGVNGRQCKVKMSEAKEVGAKFVKTWDLTASKAAGSGPGKLSTKPAGVVCLFNCSSTTAAYKEDGKTIEVVAVPYKHFHLEEFSAATGSASSCTGETSCSFVIGEDSSIEALFEEDPKFALSLAKEGGGTGIVKSKPGGILCSYTCSAISADFYEGEVVAVSWKLGKGTTSIEWTTGSGTCTGKSEALEGSCTVTMSAAKSLVAKFE